MIFPIYPVSDDSLSSPVCLSSLGDSVGSCPPFSNEPSKSCWIFSLLSFLVERMVWQLLSSLHVELETRVCPQFLREEIHFLNLNLNELGFLGESSNNSWGSVANRGLEMAGLETWIRKEWPMDGERRKIEKCVWGGVGGAVHSKSTQTPYKMRSLREYEFLFFFSKCNFIEI